MSSVAEARHPDSTPSTRDAPFAARVRRRWTVAEYHRMGEVGLLRDDERVELIAGEIVEMAPIGSEHAGHLNSLIRCFAPLITQSKAVVAVQNPVVLAEDSEPQPDLALLRWRDDCYRKSHPRPDDVLLLIEVADSTIRDDRVVKVPLYARYGIRELWLIDLPQRLLEVYREPQEGRYNKMTEHRTGSVSPASFSETTIKLVELFPA